MKVMKKCMMYIGCYTTGMGEGIYCYDYSRKSGRCSEERVVAKIENPSYLAFSKEGDLAVAVSELQNFQGKNGGAVAFYSRDQITGMLLLNSLEGTLGKDPCHVFIDEDACFLFVSNYSEGTFNSFALPGKKKETGIINQRLVLLDTIQHNGVGTDPVRQEKAHVHYTSISPDHNYLWVVDLGIDQVLLYPIKVDADSNNEKALLSREPISFIKMEDGYGPRHLVFHPTHPIVYIIQELASRIVGVLLDEKGFPKEVLQDISILSEEKMSKENSSAAIKIDKKGTYIYASNRGEDNIVVLRVLEDGRLKIIQWAPCDGKNPRDITLSPDNNFLFCANQSSDCITGFAIQENGTLVRQVGLDLPIPSPTCIKFV